MTSKRRPEIYKPPSSAPSAVIVESIDDSPRATKRRVCIRQPINHSPEAAAHRDYQNPESSNRDVLVGRLALDLEQQ